MVNINDNFEDIISKVIDISSNPELIQIQISFNPNEFYVYGVYLDDTDCSDEITFDWNIGFPFRLQSEKTQQTLKLFLNDSNIN